MASHRERDDNYGNVVANLNDGWRVIVCRDGIQWILQKRDGERSGQPRWTGRSYHRTRNSLIRVSRKLCGFYDASAMERLAELPDKIWQT